MDAQSPASTFREDLEISPRLRRFDHAESVLLVGHGQIGGIVTGDLKNDSTVWPTLVGLTGGMKESWTELETGSHPLFVPQGMAQFLQEGFVLRIHLDVSQQRKIIAGRKTLEVGAKISRKRLVGA